jgi:hypothetical protein
MQNTIKLILGVVTILICTTTYGQKTAVKAKPSTNGASAQVKKVGTPAAAGSTYLRYELNGRKVEFKKADLLNYSKDVKDAENGNHSLVNLFVSSSNKEEYKMSIMFYTEFQKRPTVGKVAVASILGFREGLPSVHIKCDKYVNEQFTFYGTIEEGEGDVEITKVEGDWIEGTFSLDVPQSYNDDSSAKVSLTNGSFRFKMEKPELQED